jgi:hypothetical protein
VDCYILLELSAMQPAASRAALADCGAHPSLPPPLTAGCLAKSGSRQPQSTASGESIHLIHH